MQASRLHAPRPAGARAGRDQRHYMRWPRYVGGRNRVNWDGRVAHTVPRDGEMVVEAGRRGLFLRLFFEVGLISSGPVILTLKREINTADRDSTARVHLAVNKTVK